MYSTPMLAVKQPVLGLRFSKLLFVLRPWDDQYFVNVRFLLYCGFLQAPPAPNLMCLIQRCAELSVCFRRLSWCQSRFVFAGASGANTLALRVWFLDIFKVFAGASGAKLNVSGPALRWAVSLFSQVQLVPISICFCWCFRRQTRYLRNSLWRWESHS